MRITWTEPMLNTLRELRSPAKQWSLYDCAQRIGVGYATTILKARELGLAGRLNRGRRSGRSLASTRRAGGIPG